MENTQNSVWAEGPPETEPTMGDKLIAIPLILNKILAGLDFVTLKNCPLSGSHQLQNGASIEMIRRNCCQSIQFLYNPTYSDDDTFKPRESKNSTQTDSSVISISAVAELTACLTNGATYNHIFPATSYYIERQPRLSHPELEIFFFIQGHGIKSLHLDGSYVPTSINPPNPEQKSEPLAFFNLIQNQTPNLEFLSLGYFGYDWTLENQDLQFHLPCLRTLELDLYPQSPHHFGNSTILKILKGAPNLLRVSPFYLKFWKLFKAAGRFDCIKECVVKVDGGASTCWDNDPESDSYEAFYGTKDEDFQNFVQNVDASESCKRGQRMELEKFRIYVSHWVHQVENEDLFQSTYQEWTSATTMKLLNNQKNWLKELGDIPFNLLLSGKWVVFPELLFLSIRELAKLPQGQWMEISLDQGSRFRNLEEIFPNLRKVRFVQIFNEDNVVEEEEDDEEYQGIQIRSVKELEIRNSCRADAGCGIRKRKILSTIFPNITKLIMHHSNDLVLALQQIFEYFPNLESLIFDYHFVSEETPNLDSILTGFSEEVCDRIWKRMEELGGEADDLNLEQILPGDQESDLEKLREGPSILCLKKLSSKFASIASAVEFVHQKSTISNKQWTDMHNFWDDT